MKSNQNRAVLEFLSPKLRAGLMRMGAGLGMSHSESVRMVLEIAEGAQVRQDIARAEQLASLVVSKPQCGVAVREALCNFVNRRSAAECRRVAKVHVLLAEGLTARAAGLEERHQGRPGAKGGAK